DAGVLHVCALREDGGQIPHSRGPSLLVKAEPLNIADMAHRVGMSEVIQIGGLRDVTESGPLAGNGLHRPLIRRIRFQPEEAPQQRIRILQWKAAQVVAGAEIEASRKVGIVELVITHADADLGLPKAVAAARDDSAQSRRDAEVLRLVYQILDKIR